jgi:putative transposase
MPQDRAQDTSDDGVQPRRALNATKRFFKQLLKDLQYVPRVSVTDKLRSYAAPRSHPKPHRRLHLLEDV